VFFAFLTVKLPSSSANEVQKETKLLLRNAKAANATTNITHQNKYPTTFKRLSEGFLWFKTAQKPPKNSFFGIFIVFFLQNLHGSKKQRTFPSLTLSFITHYIPGDYHRPGCSIT